MLQTLFALAILVSGVWYWFTLPYVSVAVLRLPADVNADKVAPQVLAKLTSERFLAALTSECDYPSRRARVRRSGLREIEIAFRCEVPDGAMRGADAIVRRALELDVIGRDRVMDRPLAPVQTDQFSTEGKLSTGGFGERSADVLRPTEERGFAVGADGTGRPLNFEVVQKPSDPARRLIL